MPLVDYVFFLGTVCDVECFAEILPGTDRPAKFIDVLDPLSGPAYEGLRAPAAVHGSFTLADVDTVFQMPALAKAYLLEEILPQVSDHKCVLGRMHDTFYLVSHGDCLLQTWLRACCLD